MSILDHLMAMEVPVDIASVMPLQIVWMYRDVSEDETARQCVAGMVKHGPTNVLKMLSVVLQLESVVVAANENLSPIALR